MSVFVVGPYAMLVEGCARWKWRGGASNRHVGPWIVPLCERPACHDVGRFCWGPAWALDGHLGAVMGRLLS